MRPLQEKKPYTFFVHEIMQKVCATYQETTMIGVWGAGSDM